MTVPSIGAKYPEEPPKGRVLVGVLGAFDLSLGKSGEKRKNVCFLSMMTVARRHVALAKHRDGLVVWKTGGSSVCGFRSSTHAVKTINNYARGLHSSGLLFFIIFCGG